MSTAPETPSDLRPLSVRSALLSVLLGAHPEPISPARLVEAGRYLALPEAGVRVALTRAVGVGDLRRTDAGYALGERLLARQRHQAEAVTPDPAPWDGSWETAAVVVSGRAAPDRAALRRLLADHRLAEVREGLWTRPANLRRPRAYAAHADLLVFDSRHERPERVAVRLWDLDGWSATGRRILRELDATREPAARLVHAAELVRHLSTDPILPTELLPATWAGDELRAAYAAYQEELRRLAGL